MIFAFQSGMWTDQLISADPSADLSADRHVCMMVYKGAACEAQRGATRSAVERRAAPRNNGQVSARPIEGWEWRAFCAKVCAFL